MPPKRGAAKRGSTSSARQNAVKRPAESDTESENEYRQRRERNNVAVKKSRENSRARAQVTASKVEQLRRENTELEAKINILTKELDLLKDLLVLRAGKKGSTATGEGAVTSQSSTSTVVVADPNLISQDHGYVSQTKRIRTSH